MFAIVVTFEIMPGRMADFLPKMVANADTSLTVELGCIRFDVLTDPARPHEVFLYEIYSDAAAFDAHLASDHFKEFDLAIADMVLSKDIKTYGSVRS